MARKHTKIQDNLRIPATGRALHKSLVEKYGTISAAAVVLDVHMTNIYYHVYRGSLPKWLPQEVRKDVESQT